MASKNPITPEQRKSAQKKLAIIGGIVVVLLVANFAFQIWRHYFAKPKTISQQQCDLHHAPCTIILPKNRSISFAIEPKSIPVNQSLTMKVSLANIKAEQVKIFLLALKTKQQNKQIPMTSTDDINFQAETVLEKTDNPQQQWMVMVVAKTTTETIGVPFKFSVSPSQ